MTTVVAGTIGREKGTGPSRRVRTEGNIPGVLYGLGHDPVAVSVPYADLRDVMKGPAGLNTVFALDLDGEQARVLVKDFQRDPIKRSVIHVDLLRVDDAVPVKVVLPVHVVGTATRILDSGGIVEQKMFQMRVQVTPDRIPISIEVDVTKLTPDGRISVGDIQLPEGVRPLMSDRITVVAPVVTRAARMAMAEDEEAEEGGDETAASSDEADASADE